MGVPSPKQETQKFQVLHLVSLRNRNAIPSLPQRECAEPHRWPDPYRHRFLAANRGVPKTWLQHQEFAFSTAGDRPGLTLIPINQRTVWRGMKRSMNGRNWLRPPTTFTTRPFCSARRPVFTTCCAVRLGNLPKRPLLWAKTSISVLTEPGHRARTRNPVPLSSSARASVNDITKALVAA